jgi:hypothetical protein
VSGWDPIDPTKLPGSDWRYRAVLVGLVTVAVFVLRAELWATPVVPGQRWTLDANLATVIVTLITVALAPTMATALKWRQDRQLAKEQRERDVLAATKVEAVAARAEDAAAKVEAARVDLVVTTSRVDQKLDIIHTLVDGRLTGALTKLDELRVLLLQIAPHDPRVQRLVSAVETTLTPLPPVPVDDAKLIAAKEAATLIVDAEKEAAALIVTAEKKAAAKLAAEEKVP